MASLETSKVKEIRYTVVDSRILVIALDQSEAMFFHESLYIDTIEGRSLSFKAKIVYEFARKEKIPGNIRSVSVKPVDFLKEYGHAFLEEIK